MLGVTQLGVAGPACGRADHQDDLPAHVTVLADPVRFGDLGEREALRDAYTCSGLAGIIACWWILIAYLLGPRGPADQPVTQVDTRPPRNLTTATRQSRSADLRILPEGPFGSSPMNRISRGYLYAASRSLQ